MASVSVQEIIDAPAKDVWSIIADFGGVHKILDPQRVKSTESDGNDVGAVRKILMANDELIFERVEWKEDATRRLIYSIVGDCILPVREYVATVKVTVIDQQRCQIDWQSTFLPVGSVDEAELTVKGIYTQGINKIRDMFAGSGS